MEKCTWGGAFLLSLSMCLTSCEDVLGHWEKPTPPECTVTSISLDKTSLVLYIDGGENTATLTPILVGSLGLNQVYFSSSHPWVATVDEFTGEVTAVGGGEATITASIGDLYVDCEVKVYHKLHDINTGDANIPANEQWEIIGTSDTYKITIGEQATAVLNGVTITSDAGSCIETNNTGGGSNIILVDGTTNTMTTTKDNYAAINTAGGPLNIFGQTAGTSKLIATGAYYGAGIGGNLNGKFYAVTILGGEIEAKGGYGAAGIGSGFCNSSAPDVAGGGDITISGGKVTATGGNNAAGIGTGKGESTSFNALCGNIKIDKTIVSVTATMGTGATISIGKGVGTVAQHPIFFGTEKVTDDYGDYIITITDGTNTTHDGLNFVVSGNTWTLTPTN